MRQLKKKQPEKAEKTFKRLKNHPIYDLAAEYQLLGMKVRRGKTLRDWSRADSAYSDLGARLALSSAEKKRKLKAFKVSERSVMNKRIRFERKAFQLVEQQGNVILLDSVDKMFLPWVFKIEPEWDTVRARVVNRNLPTTDYDVAISILNNHDDVVYNYRYPQFWAIKDGIWDLFLKKHPRCAMDRFKKDRPGHYYSRDCWFDEAREMFCHQSLDSALVFLDRYPYTVLELEVQIYVEALSKNKQAVAALLPSEQKHLEDLETFRDLVEVVGCGSSDTATLRRDLYHYLQTYAPRYSAFLLLKEATNYYLQTNKPQQAFQLLTDMRGIFRDSAVCATGFDFQTQKQAWFEQALECLDGFAERPIPQFVRPWNTSKFQEFSAVSWDEGTEAYFARKEGKETWIMRSTLENDDWSLPQKVEVLSVNKRALPLSMTADGLQMLLKVGRYLYISTRADESAAWAPPQRLSRAFPGMSRAVFAPDGSAILLDAAYDPAELWQKPSGNLYFCERNEEGKFKKPKSLGPSINTRKGREANPYLCADGKTLLFCSDGHEGFGEMDVFVSRRLGDSWTQWSEPESLGCPINSLRDDYGFTWVPEDGRGTLFTEVGRCDSDRDIWQTDLPVHARPQPRSQLRGKVLDSSGKPIAKGFAEISINGAVPVYAPISPSGTYRYMLPDTAKTVEIYAGVPGFYTPRDTGHIVKGMPAGTVLRDTFTLRAIPEIRKSFRLKYARFNQGLATLNDMRIYKELALLGRFASSVNVEIRLVCHTDNQGPAEQNLKLSQARAELLRRILIDSFKMPEKRLSAEGQGGTKPLLDNATEAGRKANQRVEVGFEIPYTVLMNMGKKPNLPPGASTGNGGAASKKPAPADKKKSAKPRKAKPKEVLVEEDEKPKKKRKNLGKKIIELIFPKKHKGKKEKEEDLDGED